MTESAPKLEGYNRLWGWFGLSYASWLTMPRVLMHSMPDEWQGKMAALLEEYDETFNTSETPSAWVMAKADGKFCRWPEWVLNYRRPDTKKIDSLRIAKSECCGEYVAGSRCRACPEKSG